PTASKTFCWLQQAPGGDVFGSFSSQRVLTGSKTHVSPFCSPPPPWLWPAQRMTRRARGSYSSDASYPSPGAGGPPSVGLHLTHVLGCWGSAASDRACQPGKTVQARISSSAEMLTR